MANITPIIEDIARANGLTFEQAKRLFLEGKITVPVHELICDIEEEIRKII